MARVQLKPEPIEKVLIVEDNEINARLASKMLKLLGYKFELATNGQEAIKSLREKSFAVVLMDIQMPEMDGREATKWIMENETELHSIPIIIAMTANSLPKEQETYLAIGMVDIIPKPLSLKQMRSTLDRWLHERKRELGTP